MCVLMFIPLTLAALLTESLAPVLPKIIQKGKDAMLTILCILLFPVVVLAELLKISN